MRLIRSAVLLQLGDHAIEALYVLLDDATQLLDFSCARVFVEEALLLRQLGELL